MNSHPMSMQHTTLHDAALLALRLIVAVLFVYHGYAKWGMWSATPEGMPAWMVMLFKFLSIAEPLGAVALVLGILTRWAAAGLGIIMLGAIYMKMSVMGVPFAAGQATGWEFDLMILGGCIVLAAFGAGCWAVEAMWKKA